MTQRTTWYNNLMSYPHLLLVSHSDHLKAACQYLADDLPDVEYINHPDVLILGQSEPIKIEEVRELQKTLSFRPVKLKTRYILLLNLPSSKVEAQQALLKTLEESENYNQFLITAHNGAEILPTIWSRCLVTNLVDQSIKIDNEVDQMLANISHQSYSQLIDLVKAYKDKDQALELLQQIILCLNQDKSPANLKKLSLALSAQPKIKGNINVSLVLEDLFFNFKKMG